MRAQLSTYKVIRRGGSPKGSAPTTPGFGSKDSASGAAGHHPADGEPTPGDCFEEAQETWMLSEFCDRGAPRPSTLSSAGRAIWAVWGHQCRLERGHEADAALCVVAAAVCRDCARHAAVAQLVQRPLLIMGYRALQATWTAP